MARRHEYVSVADDYPPSNSNSRHRLFNQLTANQIHNKIRDGEFRIFTEDWTMEQQQESGGILWKTVSDSSGWTAVHFASCYFVPIESWEWILQTAHAANPHGFQTHKTALGDTVLDLFLKSYLQPMPWQPLTVKNRSRLFLQAVDDALIECFDSDDDNDHHLIQEIRQRLVAGRERGPGDRGALSTFNIVKSAQRIVSFLQCLHLLFQYTFGVFPRSPPSSSVPVVEFPWLACLARASSCSSCCPAPQKITKIVQLFLALDPRNGRRPISTQPDGGRLPLHEWCYSYSSRMDTSACDSTTTSDGTLLLDALLLAYPEAVTIPDPDTGRSPLLQALASGRSWTNVRPLLAAAEAAQQQNDNLPWLDVLLCAAASSSRHSTSTTKDDDDEEVVLWMAARRRVVGDSGLLILWNLAEGNVRQKAYHRVKFEIEMDHLTSIWQLLLDHPQVMDPVRSQPRRRK